MAWRGGLSLSTSLGPHRKDAGEVWPWHRGLSWVFSTARTLAGGVFSLPSHHPLGLGTTCSLTSVSLHYGATHSSSSHASWEAPTVFQPFQHCLSTEAVPRTLVPAQLLLSLPSAVLCIHDPQEMGGQGCAAQQLCLAPRRRHPSTTGTFTLLLTRRWPFPGWV